MIAETCRRLVVGAVCISSAVLPGSSIAAESVPQKKPPYTEWARVAAADIIAQGKLLSVKKSGSGIAVGIYRAETFLKGKPDGPKIPIRQAIQADRQPRLETLKSLRGKQSIVFVTKNNAEPSKLADSAIAENGIQSATDADMAGIRAEVENEALINAQFSKLPIAQTDQFDHIISKLFLQLQAPSTAEQAIAKLEKLPEDVVPAIIRTMALSPVLCKRRVHRATAIGASDPLTETIMFDICAKKTGMKLNNQEGWRAWLYYTSPEPPQ